jgi:IclR family mhp operon transcriptional activator
MIGIRLPMLRTAAGRAYLSFCPDADCRAIVSHLRSIDEPADRPFVDAAALDALIVETRSRGYGIRAIGDEPIPNTSATKTSSIAVPIRSGDAVLGCITIIWLANAIEFGEGVAQFLEPMRQAASAIAEAQPAMF